MVIKMGINFWTYNYLEKKNDYLILYEKNDITIFATFIFSLIIFGILRLTLPQIPFLKGLSELNLVYNIFIILLLVLLLTSIPSLFFDNLVITDENIIISHAFLVIRYKKEIFNKLDFILYLSAKKEEILVPNQGYKKEQNCYYFILLNSEGEENNEIEITIKKLVKG